MRKIHESYDRLQNPWYRRPRILATVLCGFIASIAFIIMGLRFLSEQNREQTLDHIDEAFAQNDLSSVHRTLRLAIGNDPSDESLQIQYARLLSRIQPVAAVSAWEDVVQQSQEPEHAVAYVLAAIQVGDFVAAHRGVASLEKRPDALSEYHRAAFSLTFAEGDDAQSFRHIEALKRLHPDAEVYEIEHARIGVRSQDELLRKQSEAYLWDIAESTEVMRSDALKALANSYLDRKEENALMRVLDRARDIESGTDVLSLIWAIEAEQRMWGDVPVETVRQVWAASIQVGELELWLKLVNWMNVFGYSEHALEWATESPSESVWDFPSGYMLARSALISGARESVVDGLKNADWGQRDFLRALSISLLTERGTGRSFWLDQAYHSADALSDGGGRLLMPILWEWGWLDAEVTVISRVLDTVAVSPASLRGLFQRIEEGGDLALMNRLTRAMLKQFPEQPAFLNNAAYYALILDRDLEQAEEWVLRNKMAHPEVVPFKETHALYHAIRGDFDQAAKILDTLSEDHGLMARLVVAAKSNKSSENWVNALTQGKSLMDQERDFIARWSR